MIKKIVRIICVLLLFIIACAHIYTREVIKEEKSVSTLQELAESKMNDLLSTGNWSHTNSNGCTFKCRTSPCLEYYSWIGENLYKGPCNEDIAYKAWSESPSHLEVLQHPYTEEVILMQEYAPDRCYIILEKGVIIGQ